MSELNVVMVPIRQIDCTVRRQRGPTSPVTVARIKRSMDPHGIINPILLLKRPDSDGYILINGLHRLEAAKQCGHHEISARIIAEGQDINAGLLIAAAAEDTARKVIDPMELAALIWAMRGQRMRGEEIANHLNLSKGHVNSLGFPERGQQPGAGG